MKCSLVTQLTSYDAWTNHMTAKSGFEGEPICVSADIYFKFCLTGKKSYKFLFYP